MLSQAQAKDVASRFATHGGVTFDTQTGEHKTSGISVAIPGHETRFQGGVSARDVSLYARQNESALASPGAHLGGWREDGTDFLDVAFIQKGSIDHPVDRAVAHGTMVKNHQIAAYDLAKQDSLYNPYYDESSEQQHRNVLNAAGTPVSVRRKNGS